MDKVKYLSVKSYGRAHLACQRCRVHKIKCSGEVPICRNCGVSKQQCCYPDRDRVVTLHESEILKLQKYIKHLEKANGIQKDPIDRESGQEVLQDTYFQNSTTSDSSLFSFLDIDSDDEVIIPSNGQSLRHYYKDDLEVPIAMAISQLPAKDTALRLVRKVINFIGQEYYLFDKDFIVWLEQNYNKINSNTDPNCLCYLFITMAIGEQFSNNQHSEAPGITYFFTSMKLLKMNFEEPSLLLVQIHLLIAFYQQGLNRSNTSFTTYGTASRLALVLGLHKRAKNLPPEEQERRRRLWWTCYVMDSIWATKLGQPIHIDSGDICVDSYAIVDLNDGFKVNILRYNAELAIVMGRIMQRIYKPSSKRTIQELLRCLQELNNFQNNLPVELKENIINLNDRATANLYLRLNQIVIITARPLVLSIFLGQDTKSAKTFEFKQAIQKCITTASTNINILNNLHKVGLFSNFGFWDARYLFSSLLILYMMSGGDTYSHLISIGRELNKGMANSGNFTAIENEKRLKELDTLLNKIDHDDERAGNMRNYRTPTPLSSILADDITKIFTDVPNSDSHYEINDLFLALDKDLMPDIWKNISTNLKSWDSSGRGF